MATAGTAPVIRLTGIRFSDTDPLAARFPRPIRPPVPADPAYRFGKAVAFILPSTRTGRSRQAGLCPDNDPASPFARNNGLRGMPVAPGW